MQPLSPTTRRLYLALFMFLFAAMLPAVIFYADGWRYKSNYGFVRTGGIYVSVPYPDATISLNGAVVGKSGFLERSFYTGNLAPSAYIVHVEREGYRSWDKLLVVEEQLVTDARAVLIPKEVLLIKILVATTSTQTNIATTSSSVSRATYNVYLDAFATSAVASSTVPVDEANGVGLFITKGTLTANWIQKNAFPPSQFCERPSICAAQISISKNALTSARFFHSGVVYATKDGEIYFAEVDARQTPLNILLFSGKGADIRIVDDLLLVKSGSNLYEISL